MAAVQPAPASPPVATPAADAAPSPAPKRVRLSRGEEQLRRASITYVHRQLGSPSPSKDLATAP